MMKQFLDVTQQLTKLTNNLWETNKKIQKAMIPPKVVHWKTPLLLSIFLALLTVAAVTDWRTRTLLFDMSWLFFTLSMGLLTSQQPFVIKGVSLSPWVTSILIGLWLLVRLPSDRKEIAWISGPIIAVVVLATIEVWNSESKREGIRSLVRPQFLIITLVHLLFSCWFAFHFLIQGWIRQYPSVLSQDLRQSDYVVTFQQPTINRSRGVVILNAMERYLQNEARTKPWAQVEQMLIDMDNERFFLRNQALKTTGVVAEDAKWDVKTSIVQGDSRYQLEMEATWLGVVFRPETYSFTKSCEVFEIGNRATVTCAAIKRSQPGQKKDGTAGDSQV
ncbi:hypothetical protein D0A34_15490 [Microcoleus vaginatus PCC 9802]|uniref:DUF5357 family protein n=1 Tax=Microcoleus vaginatus TaxID=119532 RepID=UPI00020D1981|nr:hypothetical protein MicvaDRAFT_3849 [Microcoleus vaginatus FGP-2]UNU20095.1 hypothetical protein D0A34_15490 [Microcoleus vaginatus PCC 9802]